MEYVKEMQKYIDIDEYRFFLAFENTLCKDYVSEKFFNLYGDTAHTIIPVVRGGIDYDKLLPSGTFINAAHYNTTKQLATQLNYLIDNPDELAEIMQRKAAYRQYTHKELDHRCRLCHYLNTRDLSVTRYYHDIRDFIGKCRQPTDLNFSWNLILSCM